MCTRCLNVNTIIYNYIYIIIYYRIYICVYTLYIYICLYNNTYCYSVETTATIINKLDTNREHSVMWPSFPAVKYLSL